MRDRPPRPVPTAADVADAIRDAGDDRPLLRRLLSELVESFGERRALALWGTAVAILADDALELLERAFRRAAS